MEKIAVINRKGGVGKTTTSVCLAERFCSHGYAVLLVDMDQQHNATDIYGGAIEGAATVYDLMVSRDADPASALQSPAGAPSGLSLIAGDDLMNEVEAATAHIMMREKMLARALRAVDGLFDVCIIDCPTALGLASANALMAADHVLMPVLAGDECSVDGMMCLMQLVRNIAADPDCNPALHALGAFMTQYDAQAKATAHVADELARACERLDVPMLTPIRRCTKAREAASAKQPLTAYAPRCTASLDYGWLAEELIELLSAA